jgi:hypothetical protein
MPAEAFVPLGPLVEALTRSDGGKFAAVFFPVEDAVREALVSGDVPMRGQPVKAAADPPSHLRRSEGLPKRIPLVLGTRIEFKWPYGWIVHVPIGRTSGTTIGTLSISGIERTIFETFEDIAVDRVAFEDALTALAQVQCRVLPEWPAERKRRNPGRRQNPWKEKLRAIWQARRESRRVEPGPTAEARALLEQLKQRRPGGKNFPAPKTVMGWIAAGFR